MCKLNKEPLLTATEALRRLDYLELKCGNPVKRYKKLLIETKVIQVLLDTGEITKEEYDKFFELIEEDKDE